MKKISFPLSHLFALVVALFLRCWLVCSSSPTFQFLSVYVPLVHDSSMEGFYPIFAFTFGSLISFELDLWSLSFVKFFFVISPTIFHISFFDKRFLLWPDKVLGFYTRSLENKKKKFKKGFITLSKWLHFQRFLIILFDANNGINNYHFCLRF